MGIIFVLLTISICLALFFLVSFIWATKDGQFEDTYGPAVRMLFEDDEINDQHEETKNKNE